MRRINDILSRLVVAVAIAMVTAGAGSEKPYQASDIPKAPPMPRREERQPLIIMRGLNVLQDKIARGDKGALSEQEDVAERIAGNLREVGIETWRDARNGSGLLKFVLSGGDPSVLERLLEAGFFPPEDLNMAKGALAYALGEQSAAAKHFAQIDPFELDASLAGHVALVRAVLVSDKDPKLAQQFTDRARLLSPGTLVEETALRMAIELAIMQGDRSRFEVSAIRYLLRFPTSVYAPRIAPRIARVLSSRGMAGSVDLEPALSALRLAPDFHREFFGKLSEAALRSGNLKLARSANSLARRVPEVSAEHAILRAIDGAISVVGENPADGIRRLDEAEKLPQSPDIVKLIRAARRLGASITKEPEKLEGDALLADKHKLAPDGKGGAGSPAPRAGENALAKRLNVVGDKAKSLLTEGQSLLIKDAQ